MPLANSLFSGSDNGMSKKLTIYVKWRISEAGWACITVPDPIHSRCSILHHPDSALERHCKERCWMGNQ